MAASCLSVVKYSLLGRTLATHRFLFQPGVSVTCFLQQHYSSSVTYDNNNSNDNNLPDHHPFAYGDTKSRIAINDDFTERGIGRTLGEQYKKYLLDPDQPLHSKILKFSIIGIPNSGKSTLTNQLMNWKVSPVSSKVHTTRKNTVAAMTEGNTQILGDRWPSSMTPYDGHLMMAKVYPAETLWKNKLLHEVFVDTPGVVTSRSRLKHNLGTEMASAPGDSLQMTDMIGVLVDASNHWTCKELGQNILQLLHLNSHLPSILILNKVDLIKDKEFLLEITRILTEDYVGGLKTNVSTKKSQKSIRKTLFSKYNLQVPSVAVEDSKTRTIPVISDTELLQPEEKEVKVTKSENSQEDQVETWQAYHARMQAMRHTLKGKKGWPKFDRVFMISALNRDGVSELRDYLMSAAVPGNWEFHSSFVTDQDPLNLAKDLLWEKLLEILPEEVPYKLRIETEMWEVNHDDILMAVLNIVCKKKKHLHMIIGSKGSNIRNASEIARQAMMDAFRMDVNLKVHVKLENESL